MKPEIAKLWIDALRSGDYIQGKTRLVTIKPGQPPAFCCLGVLCNLHAQAHPEFAKTQLAPDMYDGQIAVLPITVRLWAGVNGGSGSIPGYPSLADQNDSGKGFYAISKFIEKHQEEL